MDVCMRAICPTTFEVITFDPLMLVDSEDEESDTESHHTSISISSSDINDLNASDNEASHMSRDTNSDKSRSERSDESSSIKPPIVENHQPLVLLSKKENMGYQAYLLSREGVRLMYSYTHHQPCITNIFTREVIPFEQLHERVFKTTPAQYQRLLRLNLLGERYPFSELSPEKPLPVTAQTTAPALLLQYGPEEQFTIRHFTTSETYVDYGLAECSRTLIDAIHTKQTCPNKIATSILKRLIVDELILAPAEAERNNAKRDLAEAVEVEVIGIAEGLPPQ